MLCPLELNVVITGVGGQGLITLASIIANASAFKGINALVAETHGLSQRGGTVIVHVRLGDVEAPLIPPRGADVMLAMELLEALRYKYYLKEGGSIVANDYIIPPPLPDVNVPTKESILEKLGDVNLIDATELALKLGDVRVANVILLGKALSLGLFDGFIDVDDVLKALELMWPKAFKINKIALEVGLEDAL